MNHQQINSRPSHYSGITYCGSSFPTHFHNSYELICVLKGNIKVTINSHSILLCEKDFLLISPCMIHSISESSDSIFFIAIITADYIPYFFETHKKSEAYIFSVDHDSFAYLKKYLFENNNQSDYQLKACFYNSYIADHFIEPIKRAQLAKITGYE